MRSSEHTALHQNKHKGAMTDEVEHIESGARAKVEHPFQVMKRQFDLLTARGKSMRTGRYSLRWARWFRRDDLPLPRQLFLLTRARHPCGSTSIGGSDRRSGFTGNTT